LCDARARAAPRRRGSFGIARDHAHAQRVALIAVPDLVRLARRAVDVVTRAAACAADQPLVLEAERRRAAPGPWVGRHRAADGGLADDGRHRWVGRCGGSSRRPRRRRRGAAETRDERQPRQPQESLHLDPPRVKSLGRFPPRFAAKTRFYSGFTKPYVSLTDGKPCVSRTRPSARIVIAS